MSPSANSWMKLDYDELTALDQLSACGLKNFMFDVAKVSEAGRGRGLVS